MNYQPDFEFSVYEDQGETVASIGYDGEYIVVKGIKTKEEAKNARFFVIVSEIESPNHYRLVECKRKILNYNPDNPPINTAIYALEWKRWFYESPDAKPLRESYRIARIALDTPEERERIKAYMPKKRATIPQSDRKAVYDKCGGHCAYCGCELPFNEMQVDHVDSHYRHMGKDDVGNYLPACRDCNSLKSDYLLEEFRDRLIPECGKLARDRLRGFYGYSNRIVTSRYYRIARKYDLFRHPNKRIEFYFEMMQKEDGK